MKKIFYLILGIALLGCKTTKVAVSEGNTLLFTMNGKYSTAQFDSMCVADTLPGLDEWIRTGLQDYETKERTYLYLYMKGSTVYKVEDTKDDSLKINKKVITD